MGPAVAAHTSAAALPRSRHAGARTAASCAQAPRPLALAPRSHPPARPPRVVDNFIHFIVDRFLGRGSPPIRPSLGAPSPRLPAGLLRALWRSGLRRSDSPLAAAPCPAPAVENRRGNAFGMNTTLAALDNEALLAATNSLVAISNTTEVDLLLHLGEVDRRRLYADLGFSSMYRYCTELLGFSKYAAFDRICVARLVRRHPSLLQHLAAGRLNLTSLRILSCVLSKEDCSAARAEEIAAQAFGLSTEDVAELAVALDPKPSSSRTPLASRPRHRRLRRLLPSSRPSLPRLLARRRRPALLPRHPSPLRPSRPARPRPRLRLSSRSRQAPRPRRHGIRFTADKETYELLKELQALLSHRKDKRDFGSILKQAPHPRARRREEGALRHRRQAEEDCRAARSQGHRHVPVDTVRAVVERRPHLRLHLGGWPSQRARFSSRWSTSTASLAPASTSRNAWPCCAAHNLLSAERMYGRDKMEVMPRGGARFKTSAGAQSELVDFDFEPSEHLGTAATRFETEGSPHFSSS